MPESSKYRRLGLGIAGLLLLCVGAFFWIWPPASGSASLLQGSCIKSGMVLCAAWLAFPKLDQMPNLLFGCLLIFLMFVALRPSILPVLGRVAILVAPVLVVLWMLRTKPKRT